MFERFTEESIKVIMLAQEESRRMSHNFVGTEFILLGLIGEGRGGAGKILKSKGVDLNGARIEVEKVLGKGSGATAIEIPFTRRAKHLLELSWDEARSLGLNYIGTEHLLLGLIREGRYYSESSEQAVAILERLGLDVEELSLETTEAARKAGIKDPAIGQRVEPRSSDPGRSALELALQAISHAKETMISKQNFDLAAWLRQRELEFKDKLSGLAEEAEETPTERKIVGIDAILEKGTPKAVKVCYLAQEEARRLGHNFVGTEQILLGLIGEGTGIAAKTLKSMGVNLKDARVEVEKIIGRGSGFVAEQIPLTPRAKRVVELSLAEAKALGHEYIGPEHFLLAIVVEGDSVARRVLENMDVNTKHLRKLVINRLGEGGSAKG